MITELEQKKLKALFRSHYTEEVLKILSERKICNRNGKPHNAKYIRMVFQGVRQNPNIEAAIWQVASNKKQKLELQKSLKQNIFNSKS
jgi:hypothetical protein